MRRASITVLGCSFLLISLLTDSLCQNEGRGQLFSVGGRPQRVRFLLASHFQTFDQMDELLGTETASIVKLIDDPIQSLPNLPQGKYIRQAKPPAAPGVGA
jgi:hypothetical protein